MSPKPTYRDNFIEALRIIMAEQNISTMVGASEYLKISRLTLSKIVSKKQVPTTEQCIRLCELGGFSMNWMLLNVGEHKLKHQATLNQILKAIKDR